MSKYVREVNECLLKLKNGNAAEFDRLYGLTANHLRGVAWIYLYNKNDCDDVVSDAFIKVYKYAQTFDENMDGYNWLCRIVQNLAYNYNRRSYGSEEIIQEKFDYSAYMERFNDIDALIDAQVGIEGLEPIERRILAFKVQMGYTVREIGKILGCSKSEVQRKYKIILTKLDYFKTVK